MATPKKKHDDTYPAKNQLLQYHSLNVNFDKNPATASNMDHTQPSRSFDTFTCFPRLPAELRVRVWEFAIDKPRQIKCTIFPVDRNWVPSIRTSVARPRLGGYMDWTGRTEIGVFGPPGVLQANKESRFESQKVPEWNVYGAVATPVTSGGRAHNNGPHIIKFFRNDVDTAFIQTPPQFSDLRFSENLKWSGFRAFQSVKTLTISLDHWNFCKEDFRRQTIVCWGMMSSVFVAIARCQNLRVLIKDKVYQWRKVSEGCEDVSGNSNPGDGEGKGDRKTKGCGVTVERGRWIRMEVDQEQGEDQASVSRAEGFKEVVHNVEFAQFLEAEFRETKRKIMNNPGWPSMPHNVLATMGMKVLSE